MNETIQMLTQQIQGYETKIKSLREDEKLFHKAQGLDESAEKARAELQEYETDIESMKEELAEKRSAKTQVMADTMNELSEKMSAVLPKGGATFKIEDEKLIIG